MFRIGVLVSGSGTNLQYIIDTIKQNKLDIKIEKVISDREAYALERAKKANIKTILVDRKIYKNKLSDKILEELGEDLDLIVLAGFLSILRGRILEVYKNRIINIHPSLIPSFCGEGMYGLKVHQAALDYGVKVSGCTVHIVDSGTDTGPIILQKTVPVYAEDTAETLQERIHQQEYIALEETIRLFAENRIKIEERKVYIK
ncbi:phosphoribosylglycinamide formyltransferase [Spirochaetia bacterium 38H-sp]|uniref:Phosphoribosylglycinamide formyltransferase n=1 Tax=Rarispira pelagica TaxID=3141764 RepID=A0ABU9UDY5_9SPIR